MAAEILNGENSAKDYHNLLPANIGTDNSKRIIVWPNVIGLIVLHLAAFYGFYLIYYSQLATKIYAAFLFLLSWQGISIGAHRFYSHRAFKVNSVMRLGLVTLQTLAGQNSMYTWVRDHRVHHKYSDTDADPHNSNRGFFFAHMGWLMCRKHEAVTAKGKTIDLSDLDDDSLVVLQKKYYLILYILIAIIIPVAIPIYLWNESFINSMFVCYFTRYVLTLHIVWLINSAAHMFGSKPYNKTINPVELNTLMGFIMCGEGWHNYHHTFPWDYRSAELGIRYSLTTFLIDLCGFFGMAYDFREAKSGMIKNTCLKCGDGSHKYYRKKQNYKNNDARHRTVTDYNEEDFSTDGKVQLESEPSKTIKFFEILKIFDGPIRF